MSHLSITLWPFDYTDTDMITLPFTHMGWTEEANRKIAQFELELGSPIPTPAEEKIVMKEVKKFPSPGVPEFDILRRAKAEGRVSQIEPQFALHTVPDLDTTDFSSFLDFTDRYGALRLDRYEYFKAHKTNMENHDIQNIHLGTAERPLGQVTVYTEASVMMILRDLKAMSRHIIAISNGEDETAPWKDADYSIPNGERGINLCRSMLMSKINIGLRNFYLYGDLKELSDNPEDHVPTRELMSPGIFSIVCFQLYQFSKAERPILKCAYEPCGLYFLNSTGYGNIRSNRNDSKYHSKRCARNAAQQTYRNKLKQGAKK